MKTVEVTLHDDRLARKAQKKRLAIIELDKQNFYDTGFFTMFQSYVDKLTKIGLSGCEWSVLGQLLTRLDYQNHVIVTQSEIAMALGINRSRVTNAMTVLVGVGCVERKKMGGVSTYRLCPDFVWKGSSKSWKKANAHNLKKKKEEADKKALQDLALNAKKLIESGMSVEDAVDNVCGWGDEESNYVNGTVRDLLDAI
jgi:predicted transcriptional regulator